VLAFSAAAAAAQGTPAADPLVKANATRQVAPHTYVILDDDVGLVPNVGIVAGSRATLVIDPGLGRLNGETVLREARKIGGNTDLFIATTHFHPEHTTGYLAFPPTAKYINSRTQEAEFAADGLQFVKTFAQRSAVAGELLSDATRRIADITFDGEYRLDLGGVRVRFMSVGPAHTRGDTALFVEEDRVLFAGDVVMKDSFLAAGASSSVGTWLAAFERLEPLAPTVLVPSHGALGDASTIAANRRLVLDIQARARALKAQGRPADQVPAAVQAEMEAAHPTWRRAAGVAVIARTVDATAR
jgi:glyoxylase-like metal-dependent hydrolase (beta-lactamase superfamily II)